VIRIRRASLHSLLLENEIRIMALPNRLRKNWRTRAAPWKSGASAPRKASELPRASAPVVVFSGHVEFLGSLFRDAAEAQAGFSRCLATWFQNGKTEPPPSRFRNSCRLLALWKKSPQSGTKPVIAGDTTYGVSLLTDTTYGSNFAIPSSEFRLTGMGRNLQHSSNGS